MREDAVLHAGEEHDRELQALGGVQGHQRDDALVLVGDLVGVGDQRDLLEEVGERAVGRGLLELAGHRDELREVLHPGLVLRVGARAQLGEVAGLLEHRLEHRGRTGAGLDQRAQLVHQRGEAVDLGQRPGREPDRLVGPGQRRRERDALALGQRLDAGLGAVADAALGHVEDAPQRHGVVGVGQRPQVGQRVADLPALVEAHAADDLVGQPDPDEHLLEDPGLRVGAVEDRDVAGRRRAGVAQPSISPATKAASSCSLSAT